MNDSTLIELQRETGYSLEHLGPIVRALEQAFEAAYLKWALSHAGSKAEGEAFIDLVEAYNEVEVARAGK